MKTKIKIAWGQGLVVFIALIASALPAAEPVTAPQWKPQDPPKGEWLDPNHAAPNGTLYNTFHIETSLERRTQIITRSLLADAPQVLVAANEQLPV